jgi:hypothetical protein
MPLSLFIHHHSPFLPLPLLSLFSTSYSAALHAHLESLVKRMGTKTDLEDFGLDKATEFKTDAQGDKNWACAHMLFCIFEVWKTK